MAGEGMTRPSWQVSNLMTLNQLIGQDPPTECTDHSIGGPMVRFRIPIYQRLYVWKKEQIERLLNDTLDAWQARNEHYFIGGTLVVERERNNPESHHLELIDGQQRLTTLLLTAVCRLNDDRDSPKEPYSALLKCRENGTEHWESRLHFEIRDNANAWMGAALSAGIAEARKLGAGDDGAQEGGVAALENGIDIIEEWFRNNATVLQGRQRDFDMYLLNSVQMLVTSVPDEMDLNHLFEAINDRSVQLEHHEVLKARMLNRLRKSEAEGDDGTYAACARVWEACSAMDDFWEDGLAEAAGRQKKELLALLQESWGSGAVGSSRLSDAALSGEAALEFCRPDNADQARTAHEQPSTLKEIIEGSGGLGEEAGESGQSEHEDSAGKQRATSLISFPMLLLHTLRIWLHRYGPAEADLRRFDSFKLLETFQERLFADANTQQLLPDARERVRSFIRLLWEIRYLLDQHVIRWVELKEGGEWGHRILRLERNKSGEANTTSLRRADAEQGQDKEFSLLQSMLYHTQDIRQLLWLTPLLGYLHARTFRADEKARQPNGETKPSLTVFIRHLDNGLFSSPSLRAEDDQAASEGSGRLMERSRAFLEHPWRSFKRPTTDPLDGGFHGSSEIPRTSHYWYYKVDFILWRRYLGGANSNTDLPDPGNQNEVTMDQLRRAWQTFRFSARTSVEHVHPQTSQEADQEDWPQETLHSFGNLALVSRERNSEFSNLPYHEKRGKFMTRLQKGDLQSPKLASVYLYGGGLGASAPGTPWNPGEWRPLQAQEHLQRTKDCVNAYFSFVGGFYEAES